MNRSTEDSGPCRVLGLALALTFLIGAGGAVAGAPVRSSYGARITADEPEYLLTAISLGEDRSLDISDELVDGRYRRFHEVRIKPQAKVLENARMVSPHDPLLPALLVPGAMLGGWLGAKLTLCLMAGLLAALLLWAAVRRFGLPVWRSAAIVGVFATSAPLAVYGSQIYPELPAAVAVTVAIICITGPLEGRGLAGLVLSITGLVWLGAKFIPVAVVLSALALWRLYRAGRHRDLAALMAIFLVAGAGYVAGHLRWYGGLTVYATGAHFTETGEFSVIGTNPDLGARTTRLIGLLVDRRFGLAAWQPAWLLMIPALGYLVRKRIPGWEVLVLPLLAGWLCATYLALTMHGWWWPGRQVVMVLPAAVLAVAAWASTLRRPAFAVVLGTAGVFTLGWLFAEGWRKQLTMVVDFYETTGPAYRLWSRLLPDYVAPTTGDWILHVIWAALAFAVILGSGGSSPVRAVVQRLRRLRIASQG